MLSRRGSRSSRSSSERLIEIESDSKESVLNTVVMPLQYPTGVGEEMAVGFAALRQMPSLRRGGWLFAYDGLVFALHSLTFHNFAQKFLVGDSMLFSRSSSATTEIRCSNPS